LFDHGFAFQFSLTKQFIFGVKQNVFFLFKEKHNMVCDLIQEPFYLSNKTKWLALVDFFSFKWLLCVPSNFQGFNPVLNIVD